MKWANKWEPIAALPKHHSSFERVQMRVPELDKHVPACIISAKWSSTRNAWVDRCGGQLVPKEATHWRVLPKGATWDDMARTWIVEDENEDG